LRLIETSLPGVVVIEPNVFQDDRGFFLESYREEQFERLGIRARFVQDNHSKSVQGALRGLHFQLVHPQAKLCRVIQGAVLDVAVDIRLESPHFGKWAKELLTAENHRQIFIPAGFAHGFLVLSPTAEFLYKCTDYYYPDDQQGIIWNDPDLNIGWDIASPLLSAKDQQLPRLKVLSPDRLPRYRPA